MDIQITRLKEYIEKQPEDFFVTADLTALTDKMDGIDRKEVKEDELQLRRRRILMNLKRRLNWIM